MFRILLIVIFFIFSLVNISKASFDVKARTAILQDYHSGEILFEKDPDISIYPASMTKIMTAIIAFDLIKAEKSNSDIITMSVEHIKKIEKFGYDLNQYSIDTVKQFYNDAKSSGFKI